MKQISKTVGGISKAIHSKLHKEIIKKYGNATRCENPNCLSKHPKRFEWALKKGHSYSSSQEDYIQLCPSCHRKYDFTEEERQNKSLSHRGSANNRAKLSEEDIFNIYDLIIDLAPSKDIAAAYNVDPSTISDIKRGKRWGHLWQTYKNK